MSYDLEKSDISFTNKEFSTVYPELLEKAKELSYKWDPTVSNESDPGVTLIKEIALALDKINYASDKNALESMPLSVTQQRTARQLFQLLGYYPKWYVSAETTVSLAWKVAEEDRTGRQIKLPAFTQIADSTGDYVYVIPYDVYLQDSGEIQEYRAIQGVLKPLEINNTSLITLDLIDSNRRVYFPDYNVAQNGIFIYSKAAEENESINDRTFWEQVDNLGVQQLGKCCYSFNVDIASNRCYVEFPIDIADLIKSGIYIKYLISNGRDGIINIGALNTLYDSSVTAKVIGEDQTITLSGSDLYIQNIDLSVTGKDQESIDDMYINYNHIKGTFDTLVTLRDYNNAVYNTKEVSNAVVCDRTNDVQESYRIMSQTLDDSENIIHTQETTVVEDGALTPFDLKIYALQYNDLENTSDATVNKSAYDNTFQMYADLDCEDPMNYDSSLFQLTQLLNDERCVQHDFRNIEKGKICLIKNIAEIRLTVFPKISLTKLQKDNLIDDVKNQIYKKYNAREINFGEEIGYDDLFNNLITSSELIKNISLNQVQYYTYALYYSDGESQTYPEVGNKEVKISDKWRQVCVSDELDYVHMHYDESAPGENDAIQEDQETGQMWFNSYLGWVSSDSDFKENIALQNISVTDQFKGKKIYLCDYNGNVYFLNEDGRVVLYSTKRNEFREEILAKNILAGITPLVTVQENGFEYQVDENNYEFPNVQTVDITTSIPFVFNGTNYAEYYPHDNEVIQFVKPQMITDISYGAYIRYDYKGEAVPRNTDHTLGSQEELIIYYKTEDGDNTPYTRVIYGRQAQEPDMQGVIISPNFDLSPTVASNQQVVLLSDTTQVPGTTRICSASQQIDIKTANEVQLKNQTNYIYVIGDEIDGQYVLKLERESDQEEYPDYKFYSVTLQGSQQFIYMSDQKTYLNIVGSGTKITVKVSDTYSDEQYYYFKNDIVSTRNIQLFGVQALDKKWKKENNQVTVLAQEFVNVIGTRGDTASSTDSYVRLTYPSELSETVIVDRDGFVEDSAQVFQDIDLGYQGSRGDSSTISYTDDAGNDQINEVSVDKEKLFDFVNGEYGQTQFDNFTNQISLTPTDYQQIELNGLYFDGDGPTTLSGIKTSTFTTDIENDTYYVINGATLFIVQDVFYPSFDPKFKGKWSDATSYSVGDIVISNGSFYVAKGSVLSGGSIPSQDTSGHWERMENGAVVDHRIEEIEGFPSALNSPNTRLVYDQTGQQVTGQSVSYTYSDGKFVYEVTGADPKCKLGNSIYLIDTTANIGNRIIGCEMTATSDDETITFSSDTRMHEEGTERFLYTIYEVWEYYGISNIILDYNTDASGAYPYDDPSLAVYGVAAPIQSNNDNGSPKGYVTIIGTELASSRKITFPLLAEYANFGEHAFSPSIATKFKGNWSNQTSYNDSDIVVDNSDLYEAQGSVPAGGNRPSEDTSGKWDKITSSDGMFSGSNPVKVDRLWTYLSSISDTKYIKDDTDDDEISVKKIIDYTKVALTNRTLDKWTWPIQNYQINFTVSQNFVTPEWDSEYAYPQDVYVKYGEKVYYSLQSNTGVVPGSDDDIWYLEENVLASDFNSSQFTITYNNRGEEPQEIIVDESEPYGWRIHGVAYLDWEDRKPIRLYDNQVLKLDYVSSTGESNSNVIYGCGGPSDQPTVADSQYSDVKEYAVGDKVYYEGHLWRAVNDNVGSEPEDESADWEKVEFDFVYLYCTDDIYIEGLKEQLTKLIDEDGTDYYPTILVTCFNESDDSGVTKDVSKNKVIKLEGDFDPYISLLTLPGSGKYIFKIKNYQDLSQFDFEILQSGRFSVSCLNKEQSSANTWDFKRAGVYYFYVQSVSEDQGLQIQVKATIEGLAPVPNASDLTDIQLDAQQNQQEVDIYPMQMLDIDTDSDIFAIGFETVLEKVKKLAKFDGRDVFNYFYSPAEDKMIENPLQSSTFNNHNHFYNDYTICKIRTYDSYADSNIYVNS